MTHELIVSGFGGQGVMAIGRTLAEAGMKEGLNVSWLPSYGPEMRGGTANCSVVLSALDIVSPVILEPNELIAMNKPSLDKFQKNVIEGGLVLVNSSIVTDAELRSDLKSYEIPCLDIAQELGNQRVANMVMLGAYIKASNYLQRSTIEEMLALMFTGSKAKLVDLNIEALKRGAACIK